jgi:EPS-associated MarR family transcriptional regulator|tara:strand:+ start:112 stop:411 length:300 start_codon:yes stop_codon:yes gene_type:complete
MKNQDELFRVLREVKKNPKISQRQLAINVNFSLGKLNYCLSALRVKGLIKMKNFQKNKKKIGYVYILTPKGLAKKTSMAINFLKRKAKEYEEIKKEINR